MRNITIGDKFELRFTSKKFTDKINFALYILGLKDKIEVDGDILLVFGKNKEFLKGVKQVATNELRK
jgi:hypothetical protein